MIEHILNAMLGGAIFGLLIWIAVNGPQRLARWLRNRRALVLDKEAPPRRPF